MTDSKLTSIEIGRAALKIAVTGSRSEERGSSRNWLNRVFVRQRSILAGNLFRLLSRLLSVL